MRVVQTLRDAEVIINQLLNDSAQLAKQVKSVLELAKQEEKTDNEVGRKFFDIANEVEFMRELNLVIHKLHHKFRRIIFEGESRWYDFDGRTPAQWFTQFAVIPASNTDKSLFLRDESNNPIWEIVKRAGGVNKSDWLIYLNLMPPKTNPITPAGYFDLGNGDFRWDDIFARKLDLDMDAGFGSQLKVKAGGQNTVGLTSFDSTTCSLVMGAEMVGSSWIAKSSSAWILQKEPDGHINIYGNQIGLSSGSPFTPILRWRFIGDELLPSGDKNIGSASFRIATYFGKYMELDTPISDVNTQFAVKTGNSNAISLVSFDTATCGIGFGTVYTGGNWIAQSSTAVILQKTTNSLGLYMNNALSVGGAFSPSLVWQFDGASNLVPGFGQNIGSSSFRVGTLYANNLDLTSGIPVSSGGTGANNATSARTNLGASRFGSFTTNPGGADSHTHVVVLTST